MVAVYGGSTEDKLSTMRYQSYCSKVCQSPTGVTPEKFPPTERSAIFHAFRVHQQVVVWKYLDVKRLDPCKWGWEIVDGKLEPVMTDQRHAPDDVMKMVRCKCTKGCLSSNCTCRRNNHACMAACINCHGITCTNRDDKLRWTGSDVSHEAEELNFDLPDVIMEEELDCIDEEIIDEVTSN